MISWHVYAKTLLVDSGDGSADYLSLVREGHAIASIELKLGSRANFLVEGLGHVSAFGVNALDWQHAVERASAKEGFVKSVVGLIDVTVTAALDAYSPKLFCCLREDTVELGGVPKAKCAVNHFVKKECRNLCGMLSNKDGHPQLAGKQARAKARLARCSSARTKLILARDNHASNNLTSRLVGAASVAKRRSANDIKRQRRADAAHLMRVFVEHGVTYQGG